jgi:hypothetical protein
VRKVAYLDSETMTGGRDTLYTRLKVTLILAVAIVLMLAWPVAAYGGWASAREITASDTLLTGTYIAGGVSDFILENDLIAVVISSADYESPFSLGGGNIVDAGLRATRVDGLMEFYSHFDDSWPRQAVYDTVVVVDDGSGGGSAVIRATGLDSSDPYLTVATEYSLAPGTDYVEISTTIINTGGSAFESFELGDAFAWGDCEKYAPGPGFTVHGSETSPWVAGTNERVSYGYTGAGMPDVWGDHNDIWSHLSMDATDLAPGDTVTYERYLAIGPGDIASLATALHRAAGIATGLLLCSVADKTTGVRFQGAVINVHYPSGAPYLQMMTDSAGEAHATVPVGTWQLEALRDGYLPGEASATVDDGDEWTHGFLLTEMAATAGLGDTLTVIQRPLLNIPSFARPGDTLIVECEASPAVTGWAASISREGKSLALEVISSSYNPGTLWWKIEAVVPEVTVYGLYDLSVTADGGIWDTARHAVEVIPEFKRDYYFVHITDTHLPTHLYYHQSGSETDSSEMVDLREVIADINIINPEFVLITGDYINEGELEDFQERRVYSKAQRMLTEFEVPTFLVAGNHDIGGWRDTPPPDGTARRDWWRFFGWKRLEAPPPQAPWFTQNYSFDYGPVHYVGLEAYDNYDGWRYHIYGGDSFTARQMQWLADDLAAAAASEARVLFYHYDFSRQISLHNLGVEMALWGHIHSNAGDISRVPYDIATDNVCDGSRAYRIVRVSDGVLEPVETIRAGATGRNLNVYYLPANNGLHESVTANVTNNFAKRFEHAMLQFMMPPDCDSVEVTGGTLLGIEALDGADRYFVGVDILPSSSMEVTLTVDSCTPVTDPTGLVLAPNKPNPFNPRTSLSFNLPSAGHARLAIYDIRGREVSILANGTLDAGPHNSEWDGRDKNARPVASGIYFARLAFGGEDRVQKMVLTR